MIGEITEGMITGGGGGFWRPLPGVIHLRSDFTKLLSCRAKRESPNILILLIGQLQMKIRCRVSDLNQYFRSLCRPSYGGKFCEGSSRSYKLCNTVDCPPNTTDYRAQQCAEFNSKQFRGWHYTWRPYTKVDGKTSAS